MKPIVISLIAVVALTTTTVAQDTLPASGFALPEICVSEMGKSAANAMPPMPEAHAMDEAHAALMNGMGEMETSMMTAMMASDLDVAFNCAMLPHHQGAINMAKAELAHGDDEESKQRAQMIIDAQQKEIVEILAWLEKQSR
ncbi:MULTISPECIES: DUF305 domain-containing protein [unclassified Devosia]|uniref:DUF305 domain-containing protein n=1 Tax=unclassified Devosia TaxID=196773 RepID=UPI00086A39FA|nr:MULTISPECIES: DUF305 domain-containing protein [unclassified Devosia]MBN9360749.1 DUF305 domain-containing protein [Devosia sp.]ODS87967.1 MAG: hypothetical protein ABS47_11185 [Devosia sp. SCN 66-27]OJX23126.1 MAG: hypothetical protein BGO83_18165 [Devosia sp. 66-14]